ncbi:MAG TPA: DUF2341 domain-containing protein [Pseudomonadales bacterium]|nr:DUF2341 domain-containing protein [Pseudomonadales bacterium]
MARIALATLVMLFASLPAFAKEGWWNDQWEYRKPVLINTGANGANLSQAVPDGVVLVRLHLGNFGYFNDTLPNGDDLRFVAADDVTPLPYHIETFDAANQIGLVWVRVGAIQPQATTQSFYMYYGNAKAPGAGSGSQTYDKSQSLVLHFENAKGAPHDSTAYGNNPSEFGAAYDGASLIGGGARFDGNGAIKVPAAPSLNVQPAKGWTFSAWLRLDQPQQDGAVLDVADPVNGRLTLAVRDTAPVLGVFGAGGQALGEIATTTALGDAWHHVAVTVEGKHARIYVDGNIAGEGDVAMPDINGAYTIGGRGDGTQRLVNAIVDEVEVASVARSPDTIALAARSQGIGSALLAFGEDAQREAGHQESYFVTTLRNVTVDGWVVIGILGLMAMLSWYVMIAKGLIVRRIRADNTAFIAAYKEIDDITDLYHEKTAEEAQAEGSDLLEAVRGHKGYVSSTLYHLYNAGMRDARDRLTGDSVGAARTKVLSAEAIATIKAALDAQSVRESQRLNSQMVLLTLAVSGGPFLGLLGTVVGVMITFAAIAASGDVNVNAIAPGIAAALVATVAGLGVAIPALFGYNYIGTRIKEVTADNRVFVDEFIATLAETYS